MYALREAYPTINSIRRELTMLIGIVMMLIIVANFIVIFGNTHVLHTSNKPIWMYDLFAILFWVINICSWLATYWDIVKDNQVIHLSFFATPLILAIWGTVIVSNVKEVIVASLWQLFLVSYISSIVVSTLFILFISQEIKRIREDDAQGVVTEDHDGVIRGTYRLMTNSGELLPNHQPNQAQDAQTQFIRQQYIAQNDGYRVSNQNVQQAGYSRVPNQDALPYF